jgi:predicted ATPase
MVGHDGEHAELLRRLEEAIAGRGSIVLVGGEPGIGKPRLTQALLADARQRGCLSLVGHCYEGEGAPPYVPFIEMLEYSARIIPPATFRHALGESASEVAKLMPELRRIFPDIPPPIELPAEQQRRFLFNAYREFMERSCAVTPLAIVLEDLHWADEPSLLLLQHVAQTIATTALLVVGTYRDVELDVTRPFARTLETLLRQRFASRISLHRLPASGVESMLQGLSGQAPPSSLSRVIFQETEGNPFFVEEVFQHLAEEGKLFDAAGAWRSDLRVDTLQVPEGVRLVIGRRLQRLSDAARRVLTTAAVVGRTFSLPLLEALETAQPEAALDAIEEAERAHLVVAESSAREPRYRFAHELIRQTLAEAVSMPRRQRLHARVAEAIERVYAASVEKHASALAHHLYQAGTAADEAKTSTYLLIASDQARAAAAHEESLAHLDNALSLWEGERSVRVADLHAHRAAALRSLGRIGEAVDAYESAIALFDADGDLERMATSSVELSSVHSWNAEPVAALRVVERTLERLGDASPMLRCRLLLARAFTLSAGGEPAAAFAALALAQQISGRSPIPIWTGRAPSWRRFSAFIRGSSTERSRSAARPCGGADWRTTYGLKRTSRFMKYSWTSAVAGSLRESASSRSAGGSPNVWAISRLCGS